MRLEYIPPALSGITEPLTIEADGRPYELIRGSMSGFSGMTATHFTNQAPNQHGKVYFHSKYDERKLTFKFRVFADSFNDMQEKKRVLSRYFTSAYGTGTLRVYPLLNNDDVFYSIDAVPDGSLKMFVSDLSMPDAYGEVTITMTAFDPFWKSGELHIVDFSAFSGGFQLPFKYPFTLGLGGGGSVINSGDVPASMIITIYGAFTQPELVNLRTGEKITINHTAGLYDKIVINTDPEHSSVMYVPDGGEPENIFDTVTSDSNLFQIQSGTNDIRYSDYGAQTADNRITIEWYDKFVGVF